MNNKIELGKKNELLEPGYVYAPYIPVTTTSVIVEYGSKKTIRKRKINKIFNLSLDIKDEFLPNKSISSRYARRKINSKYYRII